MGLYGMFMQTWDYRGFLIEPILALLEHIFDPKIWDFFKKNDFFGCVINRPNRPILMKKVRESCVQPEIGEIHNIGHIHNANFAQTQFSTSHPQK